VKLADYTTLGLGGPARAFITATSQDQLIEAVEAVGDEPLLILGGGSNLVVADEGFPGTVVHVATKGIAIDADTLTVAAGEPWDGVVEAAIAAGLSGLECLSGIPGLAGATPIQNVGAYGQEVSDTILGVRVYDRENHKTLFLNNERCDFAYRTSRFRGADRYLVLEVCFQLSKDPSPIRYAELAAQVGEGADSAKVRSAVLALRRRKGMVIDPADPDTRSAGSFFTNPIVDADMVPEGAPHFPAPGGQLKVPAAWLIEHAGFAKGHPGPDGVRISAKHTLALVNDGTGTTTALLALAREIRNGVYTHFRIPLHPEPILVGCVVWGV
jgi:UDP-N-acetylmuramate dehydrogenase